MTGQEKLSYTVKEAVAATGFARARLYAAIADGSLKTFKAGRRRMVSRAALAAFIRDLEGGSAPGATRRVRA